MRNWRLEVPESVDVRIQVSFALWNIAVLGSDHSGNSLLVYSFLESEVSDGIVFAIQLHNSVRIHESILKILL